MRATRPSRCDLPCSRAAQRRVVARTSSYGRKEGITQFKIQMTEQPLVVDSGKRAPLRRGPRDPSEGSLRLQTREVLRPLRQDAGQTRHQSGSAHLSRLKTIVRDSPEPCNSQLDERRRLLQRGRRCRTRSSDYVRKQEKNAAGKPRAPGPLISDRVHPQCPGLLESGYI